MGLTRGCCSELTAGAERRELRAGEVVLVEDGEPAAGLWMIHTGSFELVHQGAVISVLEADECFGHPSLLTGLAPAFTVRAREPSRCVWFGADAARRLLGTEAGVAYVAGSMRERLTQAGQTVHALRDVGTTPVSAIMRPAVFCAPDEPVRSAIEKLGHGASALLVNLDGDQLGIVTDADIRAQVAAGSIALDAPLSRVARTPVVTVPVGQLAVEATVDMLAAGRAAHARRRARPDPRDAFGGGPARARRPGPDRPAPYHPRRPLMPPVLERAASHLPQLFLTLSRAGVPSRDLGRVLSLQHDAIVARLIEFAISRRRPSTPGVGVARPGQRGTPRIHALL